MSTVKVIGHTPPDTDSTCSPLVYAWYLREYKGKEAQAYIGSEINNETKYILNKFGVKKPNLLKILDEDDELVIMDTNNPEELIAGFQNANIIEIIDHHKLAELTTTKPLSITIKPVASVSTILWDIMFEARDNLPSHIAGLMLGAIVSDTLNFTSPTTTKLDKMVAAKLAVLAEVDVNQFAKGMFAAKSDISNLSIRELLLTDYKNYEFAGKDFLIGLVETTDPESVLSKENDLLEEISKYKREKGTDYFYYFIVDILNSNSILLSNSENERKLAEEVFQSNFSGNRMELEGVVSRKKQIVPKIEKYFLSKK